MSKSSCFTPEIVDELLDKLSSDDQFREQFLGNPALVLHTMGVDVDPSQVPPIRRLPRHLCLPRLPIRRAARRLPGWAASPGKARCAVPCRGLPAWQHWGSPG